MPAIQTDATTAKAVEAYLLQCGPNCIVPIASALAALRASLPNCVLDDAGLADLIALQAIRRNRSVSFDRCGVSAARSTG